VPDRFWEELAGPMPRGVGYLSVYSKSDGIVQWRACLDPAAEHALFERFAGAAREGRENGRITLLISHRFSTASAGSCWASAPAQVRASRVEVAVRLPWRHRATTA